MTPDTVCPPVSNRSIDYFDREFAIELQRMSARLSFFALFTDVFCSLCFLRVSCSQWHPLMIITVHSLKSLTEGSSSSSTAANKKWRFKISAISNLFYLWTRCLIMTFVAFIMVRKMVDLKRKRTSLWQGHPCRRSSMSYHQLVTHSTSTSSQWRHCLSWPDPKAQGHSAAPVIPNPR